MSSSINVTCGCGFVGEIAFEGGAAPKCPACSHEFPAPKGIGKAESAPIPIARPVAQRVVPRSQLRLERIVGDAVARLDEVERLLSQMDSLRKERAVLRRIVRAGSGVSFERPVLGGESVDVQIQTNEQGRSPSAVLSPAPAGIPGQCVGDSIVIGQSRPLPTN